MAETVYRPTQDEIHRRARLVRLISDWDDWVLDQIMLHDNPTVETVNYMISTHGLRVAKIKITRFSR